MINIMTRLYDIFNILFYYQIKFIKILNNKQTYFDGDIGDGNGVNVSND